MCGIVGIVGREPLPEDALGVVGLLRHRGPDGEGRFASGPVAMAMRRLAIIDLDTGDQPISNESGDVVCVLNGEIYNYVELRRELQARGHRFSTSGDVETVVHLYEELGEHCFERLRGMFAAAIWDAGRGRLTLARDRFGIKPFYLAEVPGGLAFSSEIAPLLALGAGRGVDLQAISDFLSLGYVPGTATGLTDVRALAAGHVLCWQDGRTTETRYWELCPATEAPLERTLSEAVRLHLRSDVPLAVLLSGGLDSSLIAALAAAELGGDLRTFSVGFGEPGFDELGPARTVAAAIGSQHREVVVTPNAVADLPEIVRRLEEPLADPSAIPLYYVCRAAGEEVKVALAGEGGDEVFGGYSRYAWDRRAAGLSRLPTRWLAGAIEPLIGRRAARGGRKSLARRALKLLRHAELPEARRYFSWFALVSEETKAALLRSDERLPTWRVFAEHLESAPAGLSPLGRLQYADLRTMLADDLLLKADRMSMAHSLELRVPMLDHEVVAAGLGLPDERKVRGVQTKRAIRELVAAHLPSEIARRPKQGFEVPIDSWLRTDLAELAGDLLARERIAASGIVDPGAAQRLLGEHRTGAANNGLALYTLLTLELWLEQVVRGTPTGVVPR